MNPYRPTPPTIEMPAKKPPGYSLRQKLSTVILVAGFYPFIYASSQDQKWGVYFVPMMLVGVIGMAFGPLRRDARTRLCRLMWSRGDRAGAVLLYTGVIVLKYSQKRIERNRGELERFVERRREERRVFKR